MPLRASCLTVQAGGATIAKIFPPVERKQLISCQVSMIMGQANLIPGGRGVAGLVRRGRAATGLTYGYAAVLVPR
jgi:hypothetical protein